VQISDFEER